MKQSRRIMFVLSSQPLVEAQVRLVCSDGKTEHELLTDGDGQVFCELNEGQHTAKVYAQEAWVDCTFQVLEKQSLFVVDVNNYASGSFSQISGRFSGLRNQVFGDRYVFEEVIGRGGMGVVARAMDKLLNRVVAIKMLNDEFLDNQEAQQIFLEEARSIATLTHPNLVGIYDVTMLEGRAMIVFEYIKGRDLDTVFAEHGQLSEAGVLRIAIQLTRALKYLHSQGILHRDIKPSNVLMQPDGMIKIVDFGLARPLEQLALKGTRVRGTPAYMAPEQIEGSQLIAATDIYQLGVSLYELLTGVLPFSSGNMAYSHVHLDPPRVEDAITLHEPRLANLIHACLFKEPSDRPTAEELFQSFQSLYAANAVFYDQLTGVIVPNQEALFSETVELSIPEFRSLTQRNKVALDPTLDQLPSTSEQRFTTGSNPMLEAPHFEEETSNGQRLLMIAAGLVLLLFGLGSVILMLLNEPEEKQEVMTQEISSREQVGVSGATVVVPAGDDALVDEAPRVEPDPKEEIAPAVVEEPKLPDTVKTPEVVPVKRTAPPKRVVKVTNTAPKKEESATPTNDIEPGTDNTGSTEPINEKIVATTPAPADSVKKEPVGDKPTSEPEPKKRVIRKKIIRKVVRKKTTPTAKEPKKDDDSQRAPVSF